MNNNIEDIILKTEKIEWKKIRKFQPAELKKTTPERMNKLKNSLVKNGFALSFYVFEDKNGNIWCLDGHHRIDILEKCESEGIHVPEKFTCSFLDIKDEKHAKKILLAFNSHYSELSKEGLLDFIDDLDPGEVSNEFEFYDLDFDIDLIGTKTESKEDDYEIPDDIKTNIRPGDLIEIGHHRLMCGDSTSEEAWNKLMKDNMADMVLIDPPYNVNYTGKTKNALKIKNDKMSNDSFYHFLYDAFTALGSYTKNGGAWYVWHADSEGLNFRKAFIESGMDMKQCLIWNKNSMVIGRQDYHWKHEPCLYGWKPGAAHGWYSDRKQTTILNFDRPNKNIEHPTMKPVDLFVYQINNSSKSGDIVADGFLGSGTTMVAAHQIGRKCYGMEIDTKYCQVIIDRMKKLDPELKIFVNGKEYKEIQDAD